MAVPIPSSGQGIPGKTNLPTLPHAYLARERLDQLWRSWELCRVVVVEAGAGYGKTTLLAANARASRRRLLWYTFDSLDADLPGFCRNLSTCAGLDEPAEVGATDSAGGLAQALLASLLRRLGSEPGGWNVVLDDLHAVLLDHAPKWEPVDAAAA